MADILSLSASKALKYFMEPENSRTTIIPSLLRRDIRQAAAEFRS